MEAVTDASAPAKNGEPKFTLAERQTAGPELKMLRAYLENQILPQNSQCVLLSHGQYALVDDIILYIM